MVQAIRKIPISQIILDKKIYSRSGISPKRVSMFAENMRDGFKIDPNEVPRGPALRDLRFAPTIMGVSINDRFYLNAESYGEFNPTDFATYSAH